MNIGIFYQNNKQGGLDTYLINLINNFPDKKINFYVFCNKSHPGIKNLKNKLVKVNFIIYDFIIYDDLKKNTSNKILKFIFKILFGIFGICYQVPKIINILKAYKLDKMMVVSGGYPGGDANVSASIAWGLLNKRNLSIYNFHNFARKYSNNIIFQIRELIIDFCISKFSKSLITVSHSCLESIKFRKYISNCNQHVIYNGIDKERFKNKNEDLFLLNKLKNDKDHKIILMLAVYEERKGHFFLLDVFKKINSLNKKITLVIAGDGEDEYKEQLKNKIRSMPQTQNIILLNHVENVSCLIKKSDMIVIPSLKDESFGYTALESMFYKKPVVCSNVGGLKEVVQHNITGYVLEHDINLFFDSIMNVLMNEKLAKQFGEAGHSRYLNYFSSEQMAKKYFREIMK